MSADPKQAVLGMKNVPGIILPGLSGTLDERGLAKLLVGLDPLHLLNSKYVDEMHKDWFGWNESGFLWWFRKNTHRSSWLDASSSDRRKAIVMYKNSFLPNILKATKQGNNVVYLGKILMTRVCTAFSELMYSDEKLTFAQRCRFAVRAIEFFVLLTTRQSHHTSNSLYLHCVITHLIEQVFENPELLFRYQRCDQHEADFSRGKRQWLNGTRNAIDFLFYEVCVNKQKKSPPLTFRISFYFYSTF